MNTILRSVSILSAAQRRRVQKAKCWLQPFSTSLSGPPLFHLSIPTKNYAAVTVGAVVDAVGALVAPGGVGAVVTDVGAVVTPTGVGRGLLSAKVVGKGVQVGQGVAKKEKKKEV